jgi:hypothetical protein
MKTHLILPRRDKQGLVQFADLNERKIKPNKHRSFLFDLDELKSKFSSASVAGESSIVIISDVQ